MERGRSGNVHARASVYRTKVSTLRVKRTAAGSPARAGAVHIKPMVAAMVEPPRTRAPDPSSLEPQHSRAICDEVGERLQHILGRDASPVPKRLRKLVDPFAELDGGAPSIVPNREDEPAAPERPKRGMRWWHSRIRF